MLKKFFAEFLATAILVLLGCGTAMAFTFAGYTANFPAAATVGIAAAFGLSIIILAYTVGPISGGHANPAVSLAMAIRGDISWKEHSLEAYYSPWSCGLGKPVLLVKTVYIPPQVS